MSGVIKGTKDFKKHSGRVVKAVGNNVTKIRCPFCKHTMAHPRPNTSGGSEHRCVVCNRTFSFRSM